MDVGLAQYYYLRFCGRACDVTDVFVVRWVERFSRGAVVVWFRGGPGRRPLNWLQGRTGPGEQQNSSRQRKGARVPSGISNAMGVGR